ncbi:MAG: DUF1840 domain-containing protein [Burkholderiaceae bacterium]|jgi:hypothetical protein
MIYKFKSKATGDVIMLAASAEPILRLVGKAPAAQGIFEVADMPSVIDSLERAVADAEAARAQAEKEAAADGRRAPAGDAVSLRQRAWPLVEMLKRSHAANAVIVWGV